jgi:hypothetical protein
LPATAGHAFGTGPPFLFPLAHAGETAWLALRQAHMRPPKRRPHLGYRIPRRGGRWDEWDGDAREQRK